MLILFLIISGIELYANKTDIIYGFFICDDDCLYENSYEVKEAGFNITKDCMKG